jgi:hypothetical protein
MILRTCTLTLGSSGLNPESSHELRKFFAEKFTEYARLHRQNADTFIHRYPAVQFKMIGDVPMVVGINEGAEFLKQIADESREIRVGDDAFRIAQRGISIRDQEFGISAPTHSYEFATPWLALSQENSRKFYTLKGKPERDEFMQKILTGNIISMAKSLGCDLPGPVDCDAQVHFKRDRIRGENVMVFTGKFHANFQIPDLLGIGQSVSRGYGAVRRVKENNS